MKYKDVKEAVTSMVAEHIGNGCNQEEAESRVLKASIAMFNEQKIGFIDLKYIFQILGYDFSGDLAKTMDDIKKAIRVDYGITDIVPGFLGMAVRFISALVMVLIIVIFLPKQVV